MGNKIRTFSFAAAVFWIMAKIVLSSQAPKLVVYGQPILLSKFKIHKNSIYLNAENPILKQIASILGERFRDEQDQNQIMVINHHHYAFLFPSGIVLHGEGIPLNPPPLFSHGKWYYPLNGFATAFHASLISSPEQNRWYLDPTLSKIKIRIVRNTVKVIVHSSNRIEPQVLLEPKNHEIVAKFPCSFLSSKVVLPSLPKHSFIKKISFYQYHTAPDSVRLRISFSSGTVNWKTRTNLNGTKFALSLINTEIPQSAAVSTDLPILKTRIQTPHPQRSVKTLSAPLASSAYPPPTTLTGIHFKTGKEGKFEADITLSGSAPYVWHQLPPPDNRFFIDFLDTTQGVSKAVKFKTPLVKAVRLAQFQSAPVPVTRLVFALPRPLHVSLKDIANGIKISLHPDTQTAALTLNDLTGEGFTSILPDSTLPPVAKYTKYSKITIALDPGHGGEDTGAIGPGGLEEKNVTLDIGLRLRDLLQQDGFHVVMTRTTDTECLGYQGTAVAELQCRANVANYDHAALFMAIHINASYYPWVHGVSSWWYKPMDKPLAQAVQNALAQQSGFLNLGIRNAPFYVLRHTFMPAVLVELGFITNLKDEHKLENPDFREKLAEILNHGIETYVDTYLIHSHSNL